MQIVCNNCQAKYEVCEAEIPDSGREVQCSGCGLIWFLPGMVTEPLLLKSEKTTKPAQESRRPQATKTKTLPGMKKKLGRLERTSGPWGALGIDSQNAESTGDSGIQSPIQHSGETLKILREEVQHSASTKAKSRHRLEGRQKRAKSIVERQDVTPSETSLTPKGAVVRASDREPSRSMKFVGSSAKEKSIRTALKETRSLSRRILSRIVVLVIVLVAASAFVYIFSGQIGELLPNLKPQLFAFTLTVDFMLLHINAFVNQAWTSITGLISG